MPETNEPLGRMIIEMDISSVGFENSLKDMQRALKNNQQQMKAQMAVYDSLDDKIGKLEANYNGLRGSMELNEKQLKKLQDAYKDEVAASGESSEKAQKLAQQINKTIQAQAKYEAQLKNVKAQLEDAKDGSQELRNEISLLSAENRSIVANFRAQGKELEALEADYNGLARVVEERNKLIDKEKDKLQRLKQQYGENSNEYRRQAIKVRELQTSNDEARQAMSRLNDKMKEVGSTSAKIRSRINGITDSFTNLSKKVSTVSIPATAGLGIAASKMATDFSDATVKMQNNLGLTADETKELTKAAKKIYTDGYGESFEEITNAVSEVKHNLSDLKKEDLDFVIRSSLNLSNTYDADINEVTRGANGLMTSFNVDAKKAYDLLAKTAQLGGDKSKEMFDNLAEYSTNFSDAGFSIEETLSILSNGIKKGYNFDRLNDTILEFKLSAEDGGKAYEEALASLGDTNPITKAYKEYQKGKIEISDYYKVVHDNLGQLKKTLTDQEYENLGKQLFGTKWEDQSAAVVESMSTVNEEINKASGTMDKFNQNAEEAFGQRFRAFLNQAKTDLVPLGDSLLNIAEKYLPIFIDKITHLSQWFENLSTSQQKTVLGFTGLLVAAGPLTVVLGALLTPFKMLFSVSKGVFHTFSSLSKFAPSLSTAFSFLGKAADGLYKGVNLVGKGFSKVFSVVRTLAPFLKIGLGAAFRFLTGPIGLTITAIHLLVAGFKYAYKHSETFRNYVNKLKNGITNAWKVLKGLGVKGVVSAMWKAVKNYFANGYDAVRNKMTSVKTTMSKTWESIKNIVKNKVKDIVSDVTKLPGKMANAIAKGNAALKNGGKKMLNGLISGVQWGINKVIRGANKVLGFFGSSKKIDTINLSKYAKGTPQGGHKGGLAMVNDAPGSKYRELVSLPNGQSFIPKERNVVMNLPKGASVLNGKKTDEAIKGGMIPKYANGTGWLESAFTWAKNKMAKVKDWSSDIWDIVTSPDKAKEVLANFVNKAIPEKFTKGILPNAIGGLVNKLMDAAKNFLFKEKEELEFSGEGGDFGDYKPFKGDFNKISNKMGVYDFLYDLGKQIVAKFKSRYPGLYISNGKRKSSTTKAGTVSDHVYGLGLDLARGGVYDGSYYQMAKTLATHPYLKYVIGSNKWNTSKGGTNFVKFPYGGHMNHLHLSAKNPKQAKESGKSSGFGGAVGNVSGGAKAWTPQIKKAYKAMFGKNISANELAAVLEQIQTESSGNALAKQGVFDVNSVNGSGGSKGLLQFIQSTFDYYAVKGHKNIWSGYDQLLAMFNVPNWYKRITEYGPKHGWIPYGAPVRKALKGYADGGLITQHQVAQLGEGNKPEMVIPLSKAKRGRAMQLLAKTNEILGLESSTGTTKDDDKKVLGLLAEQVNLLSQQVALLTQIATKDTSLIVDGKTLAKTVNKVNSVAERMALRAKGVTV